tara:strand:- start:4198 stop:4782 length:585 start_codon:yes stop_codon:yes gene_type:complete
VSGIIFILAYALPTNSKNNRFLKGGVLILCDMIPRKKFLAIPENQREQIIAALFQAKHSNFTKKEVGLDINVPAGYSIRISAILTCELPKEIVKKIFVMQQDSNDFISALDVEEFSDYAAQLQKTGQFVPDRDDLWIISPSKHTFQAFKNARGSIIFVGIDDILKGIDEKYDTDRELRDVLRHYGIVKEGESKL